MNLELRKTLLSRSATIYINDNYSRSEVKAYLLIRQMASQFKHPIILDYKVQLNNIRLSLGLTRKQFNRSLEIALKLKFASIEGTNLRLLSRNQDVKYFKQTKRNDYHYTDSPETFKNLSVLYSYHQKQLYSIKRKSSQTHLVLNNSDRNPNYAVTLSCKAVSELLHLNSTSTAKKLIDKLASKKLINLTKRTEVITKEQFDTALSRQDRTIRYDKSSKTWYKVLASTFELNYNFKRVKLTKFERLSEQTQTMYLEMGYSIEQIEMMIN